ncbi:hypothetical protein FTF47_04210 [Salmonella enterica]|nr:hypothetical protein [Salmonella enterica]
MRVSGIARWRLAPYRGPTDSLPSVVGSPDKARQRRLRGSARTTCKTVLSSGHEDERLCLLIRRCRCLAGGADKPVKHHKFPSIMMLSY